MTVYQCDSCGEQMPGGAAGTSFLVRGMTGRTDHFCSNACLAAFVNTHNSKTRLTGRVIIGAICIATLAVHTLIALASSH